MKLVRTKLGKYNITLEQKKEIKDMLLARCFNISAISRKIFGRRDSLNSFLTKKDYAIKPEQFEKLQHYFTYAWIDADYLTLLLALKENFETVKLVMNEISALTRKEDEE